MKRHYLASVVALLLATAHSRESEAVVATPQTSRAQVGYQGLSPRVERRTQSAAPTRQAFQLLRDFEADLGGTWEVIWDEHTHVPLTLIGSGAAFAGVNADAQVALQVSQSLLAAHLELLAPGSTPQDFVERGTFQHRGLRTVTFDQRASGWRVDGASITLAFRNDRLILVTSTAFPYVVLPPLATQPSSASLAQVAEQRVRGDLGGSARAHRVSSSPEVLPIVSASGAIDYVPVYRIEVAGQQPFGRWAVFVSAATGQAVARRQLHRDFSGALTYNVTERWPGGTRLNLPAAFADLTIDGQNVTSDADGKVTWTGANAASLTARVTGPFVNVINQAGSAATASLSLADGGTQNWSGASNEATDAQLNTFVHLNVAKVVARELNPDLEWLDDALPANVNINEACNAYFLSDDNSVNFFTSGSGCGNTGQLADVVYHEFGHALHFNTLVAGAGGLFDAALSEGISDYYASTITDDSGMGRGFMGSAAPLREINPTGDEATWPDDIVEDPHITGLIIAGALWDLRELLIEKHGATAGVAQADAIFYGVMSNAPDIAGAYGPALAADDDDGTIANGTPNFCELRQAFQAHGLTTSTNVAAPLAHERADWQVTVSAAPSAGSCMTVQSATLNWRLRENTSVSGSVTLTNNGTAWAGSIPEQAAGQVVQYQIAAVTDIAEAKLPSNPADPWYEFFVGDVVELYCSDFENDPFAADWSHQAAQGMDDWEWGEPEGLARDPKKAFSGTSVVGSDLAGSGIYSADSSSALTSPTVDTSGFRFVRLQYRRFLSVEDAEFDHASISVDGTKLWENAATNPETADVHHEDGEWRFHDVDVSQQAQDGAVEITFGLTSDPGLQLSGWTVDDFCVVAYTECGDGVLEGPELCDDGPSNSDTLANACRTTCQLAACGDGALDAGELCDNGASNSDSLADACRTTCQPARCGDGVVDAAEQCDDGNTVDADTCHNDCSAAPTLGAGGTAGGSGASGAGSGGGPAGSGGPAKTPAADDGGCGCRIEGQSQRSPGTLLAWIAAVGLTVGLRRRRSRRR
jgi:cysteine-rich repeat protein